MKICFWNCNGAFRKKYKEMLKNKADIYIVSEVEDISKIDFLSNVKNKLYKKIDSDKKGILFFTLTDNLIQELGYKNYGIRYVIPIRFKEYKIFGIWTKDGYIQDLYTYSAINIDNLNNSILIGDFNSNVIWNKEHGNRNHTNFNKIMKKTHHISAYHHQYNENFGEETRNTFFMYRKRDRGYHIDYAYIPEDTKYKFKISDNKTLEFSDHMMISLDML